MEKRYEERRLWIIGALPPDQSNKDQLRLYKNAGFNVLDMTEDFVKSNSKAYFDCIRYAEEVGLKVHIKEHHEFPYYWSKNFSHVNLNDYTNVIGLFMTDEPQGDDLEPLEREYLPFFKEKYEQTGMNFVINTVCGEWKWLLQPANDYLDKLIEGVYNKLETPNKYLTIDEYPLRRGNGGNNYLDGREWIPYTALTAKKCRDNGIRFGCCIQTFAGECCDCRMPWTMEELRFLAYTYLAFGSEILYYFVYRTSHEWSFLGMVSEQGVPNALYYLVKDLNHELLAFDREYLSYAWQGIMVIDGAKKEKPTEEFIKTREFLPYEDEELAVEGAEKDLLVGCFKKGENERAYVVVTYAEPLLQEGNRVELVFKTATKLKIRRNGKEDTLEVKDGKLTLDMKQGEGIYMQTLA